MTWHNGLKCIKLYKLIKIIKYKQCVAILTLNKYYLRVWNHVINDVTRTYSYCGEKSKLTSIFVNFFLNKFCF